LGQILLIEALTETCFKVGILKVVSLHPNGDDLQLEVDEQVAYRHPLRYLHCQPGIENKKTYKASELFYWKPLYSRTQSTVLKFFMVGSFPC